MAKSLLKWDSPQAYVLGRQHSSTQQKGPAQLNPMKRAAVS